MMIMGSAYTSTFFFKILKFFIIVDLHRINQQLPMLWGTMGLTLHNLLILLDFS